MTVLVGHFLSCSRICITFSISTTVLGLPGPVDNLSSDYDAATSTVSISWSPPPALTVTGESGPMTYNCVEVVNQTGTTRTTIQSIGCHRREDRNEETRVKLGNIVCSGRLVLENIQCLCY